MRRPRCILFDETDSVFVSLHDYADQEALLKRGMLGVQLCIEDVYKRQGESVRKIEYALKYGKRLDNFFDIQSILQEVKTTNPDVQEVKIILADGRVAYSLLASAPTGIIADSLRIDLREMMRTGGQTTSWRVVDHQYNTLISIFDPVGQPIGVMDILFDEKVIAQHALASCLLYTSRCV